jgi:regulator of replication initiation timing
MVNEEEKILKLYDMACTIKDVIEENYNLRAENKELEENIKDYRESLDGCLTNAQKEVGQWLGLLVNGKLSYEPNGYEIDD